MAWCCLLGAVVSGLESRRQAFAMVDADGGRIVGMAWDVRVNQGGSYRRMNSIAHRPLMETSAKTE